LPPFCLMKSSFSGEKNGIFCHQVLVF
jgi:hypothetical protein